MSLESSSSIAGLVAANPPQTDTRKEGAGHLRLLKSVLKTIFPGVAGQGFAIPITATEAELNFVHGVTSSIQSQINTATNRVSASRQTVLSGPANSDGSANFGGTTGSTVVTASGTLTVTAANGFSATGSVDIVNTITNPSWTGLNGGNGNVYLFLAVPSTGPVVTFSSRLPPEYLYDNSAIDVTNTQVSFSIQNMTGYYGNGASAAQAPSVCVGYVTITSGVVSAINWFAMNGRYTSPLTAISALIAGVSTTFSHKVGILPITLPGVVGIATTAELGYNIGDEMTLYVYGSSVAVPIPIVTDPYTTKLFPVTGVNALVMSSVGVLTVVPVTWNFKIQVSRGW